MNSEEIKIEHEAEASSDESSIPTVDSAPTPPVATEEIATDEQKEDNVQNDQDDTPPVKRGRPRKVKKEESPERLRSPSFDAPRPKRSCRAKSEAVVAQEEDEIVSDEEPLSSDTSYEVLYGHYVKVKIGWVPDMHIKASRQESPGTTGDSIQLSA
ncbi:hypothetical protein L5515_000343 [Caenorhabditis briggsae]|uniref:Uncharacterized protein n=1 Tax=Caenorhabditis briggsae TaxID=6238 RepID=A0AAE9E1G6_CAEBR|nr:hypothetical protein L5515_000343 [Caenorhabditis briggsae]